MKKEILPPTKLAAALQQLGVQKEQLAAAILSRGDASLLHQNIKRARRRGHLIIAVFGQSHSAGATLSYEKCHFIDRPILQNPPRDGKALCRIYDFLAAWLREVLEIEVIVIYRAESAGIAAAFALCGGVHVNYEDTDIVLLSTEQADLAQINMDIMKGAGPKESPSEIGLELFVRSIRYFSGLNKQPVIISLGILGVQGSATPLSQQWENVANRRAVGLYYNVSVIQPWRGMQRGSGSVESELGYYLPGDGHLTTIGHRENAKFIYLHLLQELETDSSRLRNAELYSTKDPLSTTSFLSGYRGALCWSLPWANKEMSPRQQLRVTVFANMSTVKPACDEMDHYGAHPKVSNTVRTDWWYSFSKKSTQNNKTLNLNTSAKLAFSLDTPRLPSGASYFTLALLERRAFSLGASMNIRKEDFPYLVVATSANDQVQRSRSGRTITAFPVAVRATTIRLLPSTQYQLFIKERSVAPVQSIILLAET